MMPIKQLLFLLAVLNIYGYKCIILANCAIRTDFTFSDPVEQIFFQGQLESITDLQAFLLI